MKFCSRYLRRRKRGNRLNRGDHCSTNEGVDMKYRVLRSYTVEEEEV